MARVEIAVGDNGRGRIRVDGVDLSASVSAVDTAIVADSVSTVSLTLSLTAQDVSFGDAQVSIKGTDLPDSMQRALYDYLAPIYGA
jgi:hypothetical protein